MKSKGLKLWRFILAGILFISGTLVQSGVAQENEEKKILPITVTSERMDGDFESGIITFMDHVKVVRGEMVLHAEKVEVYPKDKGEDVERMVATGDVRVVHGTRASVSDRVEYVEDGGLLILTGNAKVVDGNNTITGPLIRVYLNEDRAEVEGNTVERPKFLFYPDSMKKQGADGK
jgi:lipopolysaccharide export system protein LptA